MTFLVSSIQARATIGGVPGIRVLIVSDPAQHEALRALFDDDPNRGRYTFEAVVPGALTPEEITKSYQAVILGEMPVDEVMKLGQRLRSLDGYIEFIPVVSADRQADGVRALRAGAFDFLTLDVDSRQRFWEVLEGATQRWSVDDDEADQTQSFGDYFLYRRLAVGGMAEVFLAKDARGRVVVVKRLRPELADDVEFRTMLIDEARISSLLEHPNIVRLEGFGKVGDQLYLALEYVPGCNLLHLARKAAGAFTPGLVVWIAAELCAALDYAHRRLDERGEPLNIVHRDVSPPNVLVSLDGRVMLSDFGIAKAARRSTETVFGVVKGKVDYMSPEQLSGLPADSRSDLFAVGVMLYELLAGRHPFRRDDPAETAAVIRTRDAALLGVAPELDGLVARALARDPDQRYAAAAELEGDLRRWLNENDPTGTNDVRALVEAAFGASPLEWDDGTSSSVSELFDDPEQRHTFTGVPAIIPTHTFRLSDSSTED